MEKDISLATTIQREEMNAYRHRIFICEGKKKPKAGETTENAALTFPEETKKAVS